ncbi:GTP-binding protein [Acidocella sp.]|uniref:GTP-binding protein n=1 Tax=Acidocella sp. TaxID=50710 RepID=UPI00342C108B
MCGVGGCGGHEHEEAGHHHDHDHAHPAHAHTPGLSRTNLVSSPGAGKTTLLVRTIAALQDEFPNAVIEGDQQTPGWMPSASATGLPAWQINTGKGCHLEPK